MNRLEPQIAVISAAGSSLWYRVLTLVVTLAIILTSLAASHAHAAEGTCPNEAIRAEQGEAALALPECRAYEQVSAPGAQPFFLAIGSSNVNVAGSGSQIIGAISGALAAADGDRLAYFSSAAGAAAQSDGPEYLSRRTSTGWSTEDVVPPQSTLDAFVCLPPVVAWSRDLRSDVLADGGATHFIPCDGADEPPLVPGEPRGDQNLFLHDADSGSYELINRTPGGLPPSPAGFAGGSSDLSHVVFNDAAPLLGDGVSYAAYEYAEGSIRPITILPDGSATGGSVVESGYESVRGQNEGKRVDTFSGPPRYAVSADGERVVWETDREVNREPFPTGLYLRLNAAAPGTAGGACSPLEPELACTVRLDAVQGEASGEGVQEPIFRFSSADGSRVFFTDEQHLTEDATAASGAPDLYEYDLHRPAGERLADLSVDETEPADVLGVAGISEDGTSVYFVAKANLDGTAGVSAGANLYRRKEGQDTFIASLLAGPQGDSCDWGRGLCLTSVVSPNGRFLAFNSSRPLTGYDSDPAEPEQCVFVPGGPGAACQEVFLYDSQEGTLNCASCDPGGPSPTGPATLTPPQPFTNVEYVAPYRMPRYLSDSGTVYFDTASALVPSDENGVSDVYEYSKGRLDLISSGKSPEPSYFYEADESGENVFLITAQGLLASDTDGEMSIYDARVDGGFPEPPAPPGCEGESCRGPATRPSGNGSPGTPSFNGPSEGPGTAHKPPCKKGFAKKHGKCVKKSAKQEHRKSKKKKHAGHERTHAGHKSANRSINDRRAGK